MKILIVHQYYLLPGLPGGSRFNEFARLWAEAGHEITVLAGDLDYQSGKSPERYRGRWLTKENDGDVTVWRCHVPASYNKGYVGRAAAFAGFTLSATTAALRVGRPDIVIATSPPLFAVIPGWIAARARFRRAPWIFEVRDLWPESAVTTGVIGEDSIVTRTLSLLEKQACKNASRINVLTPAFRDDIVSRGLASPEDIVFVPNGADTERFQPRSRDNEIRRKLGWRDRFVVMYAGAHGRANALKQLIDAAAELRDRPDIFIACVGNGPEREQLRRDAHSRGVDNIMFHDAQPKELMPELVNACDVGAAVLQDNPTFRTVYPNKIFDYMSCARPTLLAIDGVARELVCDDARAGVFAKPENGKDLARVIRSLAGDPEGCRVMGERGRQWVLDNAARDVLAVRYLKVMEQVLADKASR